MGVNPNEGLKTKISFYKGKQSTPWKLAEEDDSWTWPDSSFNDPYKPWSKSAYWSSKLPAIKRSNP